MIWWKMKVDPLSLSSDTSITAIWWKKAKELIRPGDLVENERRDTLTGCGHLEKASRQHFKSALSSDAWSRGVTA